MLALLSIAISIALAAVFDVADAGNVDCGMVTTKDKDDVNKVEDKNFNARGSGLVKAYLYCTAKGEPSWCLFQSGEKATGETTKDKDNKDNVVQQGFPNVDSEQKCGRGDKYWCHCKRVAPGSKVVTLTVSQSKDA